MRTRPQPLIPDGQVAKAHMPARPAPPENKPAEPVKWFKVLDGPHNHTSAPGKVGPFRKGAGEFTLTIGKVFNSGQYQVDDLKNAGVKLEEVPAPGWYVEAQRNAQARVEELRADGIDVEDAPEYAPVPSATSSTP